jgi:hypothetical protein
VPFEQEVEGTLDTETEAADTSVELAGVSTQDTKTEAADASVEPAGVSEVHEVDSDQVTSSSKTRELLRNVLTSFGSMTQDDEEKMTYEDIKPEKPTMGGLSRLSKNEWSAWTGGKPTADWTGLAGDEETKQPSYSTPNQLRPVSAASAQKGYNHRKTGMTAKYECVDDLVEFKYSVWEHLEDTGMDTIAYLPDPAKPSRMMNIVKEHSRFTLATAKELSKTQAEMYDGYDKANDAAARKFLLASIEKKLSNQIYEKLSDDATFPDVWLQFIKSIQSTSIERFDDLIASIEARRPSQYSGENLESMASDYRRDARELCTAGHYEHKLTLKMAKSFLLAGGPGNENFRSEVRTQSKTLSKALLAIAHKERADADKYMVDQSLTYMDICQLAEDEYRAQYDNKEWPPAKHVRDSKAVPSSFGANVLYPSGSNAGGSGEGGFKGTCFNCQKEGHMSRDCPSPKTDKTRSPNGRPPRTNQNRSSPTSWKTTAPAPGEPTTRPNERDSEKPFQWCAKCKRYTTSHNTAGHTGGKSKSKDSAAANLAGGLVEDASAWHVSLGLDTLVGDVWALFAPYLIAMLIGVFLANFPIFPFMNAVGTFLSASSAFILQYNWSLLAPLLWLSMLVAPILLRPAIDPHFDPTPRHYRRQHGRLRDRENARQRRSCSPGSIRVHGLHRQYPLSLRSLGHFICGTPRQDERAMQEQVSYLHNKVNHLIEVVESLRTPQVSGRTFGRSTGRNIAVPCHGCQPSGHSPRLGRAARRNRKVYQPIPANGHHNLGNSKMTEKQVRAATKISAHFHMARIGLGFEPAGSAATLRMALQSPQRFQGVLPKEAKMSIIWDSGASISLTFDRSDFVGPMKPAGLLTRLQGIAKGLRIEGQGHVLWPMLDTTGQLRLIKVPAFYVPKCNVRLLSTTSLLQTYSGENIVIAAHQMKLTGIASDPTRGAVIAVVNPRNNLPTTTSYRYDDVQTVPHALSTAINLTNDANTNLSEPEKELLRWHARLGHLGFRRIQFLMRSGTLSRSESTRRLHVAAAKITHPPKCAACQFGKQKQRPSPGKTNSAVKDLAGVLKTDHLFPGQCVSVDHFICSTKGRLFTSRGKTSEEDMYSGGCLFVDHATNHIHIELQAHLTSHETLKAKGAYELMCRDHGVVPQSYLSDNGSAFTSGDFSKRLAAFEQVIRFAGVGAHHSNGNSERSIQTVMSIARTMMLHAAIHWPDLADAARWPMAVAHAVWLCNHVPNEATGLSAHDLFTKTRWEQSKFHDLHVWGCPVYVLEKTISDGRKLPR